MAKVRYKGTKKTALGFCCQNQSDSKDNRHPLCQGNAEKDSCYNNQNCNNTVNPCVMFLPDIDKQAPKGVCKTGEPGFYGK